MLAHVRFGRTLIAVEVVSVLRHQIQQQYSNVKPEDAIINFPSMTKQRRDKVLWATIGVDHCHSERRRITRIAKAQIVDIYDSRKSAIACDNDVLRLRIMEKRCRLDGI